MCVTTRSLQLQDGAKKKFTKCEHIDVDWGVGGAEGEEDIYQTPVGGGFIGRSISPGGGIKRSETTGNLDDSE